jgi:hypothetical protein
MFELKIELGNDAMQTRGDVADALVRVVAELMGDGNEGGIRDENGNTVGQWSCSGFNEYRGEDENDDQRDYAEERFNEQLLREE